MALKREKPRPVDWVKEAQRMTVVEESEWTHRTIRSTRGRMERFFWIEDAIPAKNGKRDQWSSLAYYRKGISWGPSKWRG